MQYKKNLLALLLGSVFAQPAFSADVTVVSGGGATVSAEVAVAMFSPLRPADATTLTHYPFTFTGHDKLDLTAEMKEVFTEKRVYRARDAGSFEKLNKIIDWHNDRALKYLSYLPDSAEKVKLQELLTLRDADFVDLNRVLIVATGMRALALASHDEPLSGYVKNLFEHTSSKMVFALFEKDASGTPVWQTDNLSYLSLIDDEATPSRHDVRFYSYDYVPEAVNDLFKKEYKRLFPRKAYIPMPNTSIFGLTFLVRSWLNGIYPIAMPVEIKRAHGDKIPQVFFAWHDYLHSKGDVRKRSAKEWGYKVLSALSKKDDAPPFAEITPRVAKMAHTRFAVVNELMQVLIDNAAKKYSAAMSVADISEEAKKIARQNYNKTIVPIFYLLHEASTRFSVDVLNEQDSFKMLNTLVSVAAASLGDLSDIKKTPNFTDVIKGTYRVSDAEIKTWCLENLQTRDSHDYTDKPLKDVKEIDSAEWVIDKGLSVTDIKITTKRGHVYKFSFSTRAAKYRLYQDFEYLMKISGKGGDVAPRPTEETEERSVETLAVNYLSTINASLQSLLLGLTGSYPEIAESFESSDLYRTFMADNEELKRLKYFE